MGPQVPQALTSLQTNLGVVGVCPIGLGMGRTSAVNNPRPLLELIFLLQDDNIKYQTQWLQCMKDSGLDIDYIGLAAPSLNLLTIETGIWNERPYGPLDYTIRLRQRSPERWCRCIISLSVQLGYRTIRKHQNCPA